MEQNERLERGKRTSTPPVPGTSYRYTMLNQTENSQGEEKPPGQYRGGVLVVISKTLRINAYALKTIAR